MPFRRLLLASVAVAAALVLGFPWVGSLGAADSLWHPTKPPGRLSAGSPWDYALFKIQISNRSAPLSGPVRILRPDGTLAAKGQLRSGKLVGAWTIFSDDQRGLATITFRAGVPHGAFRTYHPTAFSFGDVIGRIHHMASMRGGKFVGPFASHHGDGTRMAVVRFVGGRSRDLQAWNQKGEELSHPEAAAFVAREVIRAQSIIGYSQRLLQTVVERGSVDSPAR